MASFLKPVKKFETMLRVSLVLGTFPETLTRNHHLSFIFHQFLTGKKRENK